MPERNPVTPETLFDLQFLDAIALSPDGSRVVYQVRSIDPEKDGYESHLWLVPMRGGEPRRLTFGEHKNGSASWSPDGKSIAFVSDRRDKKAQIYRLSLEGGEAERLTDLDGLIGGLSWSPDGTKLSFTYRANDPPETGHLPNSIAAKSAIEAKAEKKDPKPPTFRHLTRLHYKEDGQGFLPKSRFHVHVFEIAYLGNTDEADAWGVKNVHVWSVSPRGGHARDLTPDFDRTGLDLMGTDLRDFHEPGPPVWSPDGTTVYFSASDEGSTHLFAVPSKGGAPRRITSGALALFAAQGAKGTKDLAVVRCDHTDAGTVGRLDPATGAIT